MRQLKIGKSITTRETASIDKYLSEVSKIPLITIEEECILAQRIRDGDKAALHRLTSANLRFVVSVAKQYQHQGISLSDLINEGNLGLIKAAQRFDETRGFKFISYAVWWIRQCIMQAVAEQARVIRLPLNKIGLLGKIRRVTGVLEQELGRTPVNHELAEALDISLTELDAAVSSSGHHVSTDAFIGTNEDFTFNDVLTDTDAKGPDHMLMKSSLNEEIIRSLDTLSPREKDVILMYYGIGMRTAMTLEEIGGKFDLTRERVRQIKEKAIRRLRMKARNRLLRPYLG